MKMNVEQEILGFTPKEEPVILYTLTNKKGASVKLINIGAAVAAVVVPDKEGNLRDVVLGYKQFNDYLIDPAALGKSVGRYANRIAKGRFTLDGKEYRLAINNGPNALHGGPTGFQSRVWGSRVEKEGIVFSYVSADGEENYPGELSCEVLFSWNDACELTLRYFARSTKKTIINLTNHTYFNLNGEGSGDILGHQMKLYASNFLPTDETQIPTGAIEPVKGTPMDFTACKTIGEEIKADYKPLIIGKGYDHCWVLDGWKKGVMQTAGELYSPQSGIHLTVSTTQPGIQIYTGNWLSGTGVSKAGKEHQDYEGVAMECQNWPDSPNKPNFPSPVLEAGETYEQTIQFKFDVA